jgi:protein SERAC1
MKSTLDSTRAIIFMGTPHSGSQLANWGRNLAKYLNTLRRTNIEILGALAPGSQVLVSLQKDFQQMLLSPEFRISIFCFYEEYAVTGIGKIVADESAIMEQYQCACISANHMDMAKFGARNDSGYVSVLKLLQSWMKDLHVAITGMEETVGRAGHKSPSEPAANRLAPSINSTVIGGQVYFGDVNHCGSGNINFHAGG